MKKNKTEKKESSKGFKIFKNCLTGVIIALIVGLALGPIIGFFNRGNNYNQVLNYNYYGNFVVLTDSMEPLYKKGNALVTAKTDVDKLYQQYLDNEKKNQSLKEEYYQKLKEVSNNYYPTTSNTEMMSSIVTLLDEYEEKSAHIDITFIDGYEGYNSIKPKKENDPVCSFLNNPIQLTYSEVNQRVMTHRLREIQVNENVKTGEGRYIFIVSGINIYGNQSGLGQYQAFTEKEFLGQVVLNSSFLGGFFKFVASPWGLVILLLIPSLYLILTSCKDIYMALKEKDDEEEMETASIGEAPKNPVAGRVDFENMSKDEKEKLKAELLKEMLEEKSKKK